MIHEAVDETMEWQLSFYFASVSQKSVYQYNLYESLFETVVTIITRYFEHQLSGLIAGWKAVLVEQFSKVIEEKEKRHLLEENGRLHNMIQNLQEENFKLRVEMSSSEYLEPVPPIPPKRTAEHHDEQYVWDITFLSIFF